MLKEMWRLLRDFVRDFSREAMRGTRAHWKGLLVFCGVAFLGLIVLTVVALKATASPKFCGSCHNMQTYIESWEQSSHREVSCLACHFEPGVLGELKGKWKAQTHIVQVITGKIPSRPHTQISDASCLRQGCHSTADLGVEPVTFKGVTFSHATHLGELRRGKKLKCVTCHSQIVQGDHLTVTESTCFICHFYGEEQDPALANCNLCHVQMKAKIYINANEHMPFVHKDYLDRGVVCGQCHFDVVFGDGHLKDNSCVQCHAEPRILLSRFTSEIIHQEHVTQFKVECFRCHTEIEHGILRPGIARYGDKPAKVRRPAGLSGFHYDDNCVKCHSFGKHDAISQMYRGTGAAEVADLPSPMYIAHADCGSCHIYLTESGGTTQTSFRHKYEDVIKACSDCHGAGYDDMAEHWKKLLTEELKRAEDGLGAARREVGANRGSAGAAEAAKLLDVAEKNLAFVRAGRGLHNMDYALKVLADCRERAEKARSLVVSGYKMAAVVSPSGCTQLCHSCVECIETTPVPFGNVQFPHDIHVNDEGMGCQDCHTPRERHGLTFLKGCSDCHHGSGAGAVACADCHVENHNLYNGQNACDEENCDVRGTPNVMAEGVSCAECHVEIADGKASTTEGVTATCVECHDDSYGPMVADWKAKAAAIPVESLRRDLEAVQRAVLAAIQKGQYTYDVQDYVNNAEKNLILLVKGNAVHNHGFAQELAERVKVLIAGARQKLQRYTTIRTLPADQYK